MKPERLAYLRSLGGQHSRELVAEIDRLNDWILIHGSDAISLRLELDRLQARLEAAHVALEQISRTPKRAVAIAEDALLGVA